MSEPDLADVLRLLAEAERAMPDPAEDLARGQVARRRRTRRRASGAAAAAVVLVVAGVGVGAALGGGHDDHATSSTVRLVAANLTTSAYTFGLTPQGWSVQGQNPNSVTIAPDDGTTDSDPDSFVGKLVILFDQEPTDGTPLTSDGRTYYIHSDTGYTTLSTHTRPGEPHGVVRVQYPDHTGWSRSTMLAFLGSVQVHPGAQPGLG
jgi:hypothetical protein